jgi:uncharacterized protein YjbI with pentapeptide repeats
MKVNLGWADFRWANLEGANLEGANLEGAKFRDAHYLTFDQLSKVKTLHDAKLNAELLNSLSKEHAHLFKR